MEIKKTTKIAFKKSFKTSSYLFIVFFIGIFLFLWFFMGSSNLAETELPFHPFIIGIFLSFLFNLALFIYNFVVLFYVYFKEIKNR